MGGVPTLIVDGSLDSSLRCLALLCILHPLLFVSLHANTCMKMITKAPDARTLPTAPNRTCKLWHSGVAYLTTRRCKHLPNPVQHHGLSLVTRNHLRPLSGQILHHVPHRSSPTGSPKTMPRRVASARPSLGCPPQAPAVPCTWTPATSPAVSAICKYTVADGMGTPVGHCQFGMSQSPADRPGGCRAAHWMPHSPCQKIEGCTFCILSSQTFCRSCLSCSKSKTRGAHGYDQSSVA